MGPVAQVVEQLTFNQWVEGSNPSGLTIIRFFVFCLLTAENLVFLVYCGLQRFGRVDWSRQNQQNTYSLPFYFANKTANRTAINTTYRRLGEGNLATSACSFL